MNNHRFSYKTSKTNKKLLKLFLGVCFVVIMLSTSPIFFKQSFNWVHASSVSTDTIKLENYQGQLSGLYSIFNEYTGLALDIHSSKYSENRTPIISYAVHNNSNQIFYFQSIDYSDEHGVIYYIKNSFNYSHCFDIDNGSSADGAKLQIYTENATIAQKFVIKEVYEFNQNIWKFKGYVILTGSSNYTKALKNNGSLNSITQTSFNKTSFNQDIVWNFKKQLDRQVTSDSAFKNLNTDVKDNFFSGFNAEWEHFSNFISLQEENYSQKARFNSNGLPVYNNELALSMNYIHQPVYADLTIAWFYNNYAGIGLHDSSSTLVDGYIFSGGLGQIGLVVNYASAGEQLGGGVPLKFSKPADATKQNLNFANTPASYHTKNGNLVFDKPGTYSINIYYSVSKFKYSSIGVVPISISDEKLFFKRTISFEVVNANSDLEALAVDENEEIKVISSYTLSLDANEQVEVAYSGNNEKYNIKANRLLSYMVGVKDITEEENLDALNEIKDSIRLYKTLKIYFTNTPFYMSRLNNINTHIYERVDGFNASVPNVYYGDSNKVATNGIYSYISQNKYVDEPGSFYRVYFQSHQNYPVLRNVSYLRLDENNKAQNYCIEYALLELSNSFPMDLLLNVSYKDLSSEHSVEVNFNKNTMIYNTGSVPKEYEVTIEDIFGNTLKQYVTIYPAQTPTIIKEKLLQESMAYAYHSYGFEVPIMTENGYKPYLFSTKKNAYEYALYHIFESENEFNLLSQNENGVYTLNYYNQTSNEITFYDNASLMSYLNTLLDEIIIERVVLPNERESYGINDKSMYDNTIYLQKHTNMLLDIDFLLFETYKVEFIYYNNLNEIIKKGTITHTGEYQYTHSMFQVLANQQDENWEDGYVVFKEYSILGAIPNEYVGYIKVNSASVQLKKTSNLKTTIHNIQENEQLTAEQFSISPILNDTQAVAVVNYNNQITRYHNKMLNTLTFKHAGNYQINIFVRNGKSFAFEVNIQNLNDKVSGVENFGTTSQTVTFVTTNPNAKIYIDGLFVEEFELTKTEPERTYTFEAGLNRDIVIVENGLYFCFKQEGGTQINFATSFNQYDQYNLTLYTLRSLYQYESSSVASLNLLETSLDELEQLISEINNEAQTLYQNIHLLNANDLTAALNAITQNKLEAELLAQNEQILLDKIALQNSILKQINIDYSNIFVTESFTNRVETLDQRNYELQQQAKLVIEQLKLNLKYTQQIVVLEKLIELEKAIIKDITAIELFEAEVNSVNKQLNELQGTNITNDLKLIQVLQTQILKLQNELPAMYDKMLIQKNLVSNLKGYNNILITTQIEQKMQAMFVTVNELENKIQQSSIIIIGNQTFMDYMSVLNELPELEKKVNNFRIIKYILPDKWVAYYYDYEVENAETTNLYSINYLTQKFVEAEELRQEILQYRALLKTLSMDSIYLKNALYQVDRLYEQISHTQNLITTIINQKKHFVTNKYFVQVIVN